MQITMEENWAGFVKMTREKARGHGKVAQYWDKVNSVLTLAMIFLSTATTLCTLLPVKSYVASTIGAITTLVAAVFSTLAPDHRRQVHNASAIEFRTLMLKMIRVETERHYEELWREYNKEMVVEPFLPQKYKKSIDETFSMSPEFELLTARKVIEVEDSLKKYEVAVKAPSIKDDEAETESAKGIRIAGLSQVLDFVEDKIAKVTVS